MAMVRRLKKRQNDWLILAGAPRPEGEAIFFFGAGLPCVPTSS
jgi:hypothetical protein